MSWIYRYRLRMFLKSSLWVVPVSSMAAALLLAPLIRSIDQGTQWTLLHFEVDSSRLLIGALSSSLLTLIVFAFSIILLAVQIAGGQYSPRIISRVFESRLLKLTLGVFVFSFTYTMAVLGRIEERVPQLPVLIAVLLSLLTIALFLFLIQETGEALRPIEILSRVAADTRAVIRAVYPTPFFPRVAEEPALDFVSPPAHTIVHSGCWGAVQAFDAGGLLRIAERAGCVIELVPQVGDNLGAGEDLFRLHGATAGARYDDSLRRCVALGPERVLDNDPAFGFRILVDTACKALSPAINDPTTGALAVDHIQHLLNLLCQRNLDSGVVRDSAGKIRLVYPTPTWEDFVTLAVTEIRVYGASNPQVTRRLQAMFAQLLRVAPEERARTLRKEAELLQRTIDSNYSDAEDRILAGVADSQGFGGRTRSLTA